MSVFRVFLRILFIIIFLSYSISFISSQETLIIEDYNIPYALGKYIALLEDNTGLLTISDIISEQYNILFKNSEDDIPNFGYTNSSIWVRFSIINKTSMVSDWLLEVEDLNNMDIVELYIPNLNGEYSAISRTRLQNTTQSTEKSIMNFFKILLPLSKSQTFYMRFQNENPLIIPLVICNTGTIMQKRMALNIFSGIIFGIILIMILYNLFIFLFLKDLTYLYYVLYILGIGIFQFIITGYAGTIFPNFNRWLDKAETMILGFAFIWGIQFCRSYLLTKKITPIMDKVLFTEIWFCGFLIISVFIFPFILRSIISSITVLIIFITAIISIIFSLKNKYTPAFYYLISIFLLIVGVSIFVLRNFGILPNNFITQKSSLLGSTAEAVLLAFGLAYRIDLLRKEKEKARREAQISLEKADKLEHEYKKLFELIPSGIAVVDNQARFITVNNACCRILAYKKRELLDRRYFEFIIPQQQKQEIALFKQLMNNPSSKIHTFEKICLKKGGGEIDIKCSVDYTLDNNNQPNGLILCFEDITEIKAQAKKLRDSLEEKKILLKEIHHRVKNNLQIIISLLRLQINYIQQPEASSVFIDIQNRINSMVLVHKQLYQSPDIATILFSDYIQDLCTNLITSHRDLSKNIQIKMDIEKAYLNIDSAVPCGLIINELVTNSLKHAFVDTKMGKITISFNKKNKKSTNKDKNHILIIRDNGSGLPNNLDIEKNTTFGLKLVHTLVEQLEGKLEIIRKEGTTFRIIF